MATDQGSKLTVNETGIVCSYRVEGMPVGAFMRRFSADTGLSVVWAQKHDEDLISLNVESVEARDVLLVLSRRLSCALAQYGDLYYLGDAEKTDRACYVGQVLRASKSEIQKLLSTVTTAQGSVSVWDDGAVLVVDEMQAIRKVDQVIRSMGALESSMWAVQFYIVQTSNQDSLTAGLNIDDDISMTALLSSVDSALDYAVELDAILRYEVQKVDSHLVARPLLLLRDGKTAKIQKVESIPVPQYTTSDQGTVTVSGYDTVDIGFNLSVTLRDWGRDRAGLTYSLSIGEITGYVNETVPIERKDTLSGETLVVNGGVYLLGSMQADSVSNGASGFLGTLKSKNDRSSVLKVWAKVVRI